MRIVLEISPAAVCTVSLTVSLPGTLSASRNIQREWSLASAASSPRTTLCTSDFALSCPEAATEGTAKTTQRMYPSAATITTPPCQRRTQVR